MSFDRFNLHPHIAQGIAQQGFTTPTPIQDRSIPVILENKDLLGIAQTGTGKTAAFVLPILQRLSSGPRGKLRALVIAPTRELAIQIDEVIKALGRESGIKSARLFGGAPIRRQITRLRAGVDVVVACPGRLIDHINRRTIKVSDIEMFVLDEADQMFDMGFLPAIREIVEHLPRERQTLLFSATMPDDIRKLADSILHEPVTVKVGRIAPPQTIEHSVYPIAHHQKAKLLLALFDQIEVNSVLVFTRTKHRAKRLAGQLDRSGYKVASLQGNLSQNRRKEAMDGFRKGKYNILVATDIAARGIDISTISHVINFDVPTTAETYTHRIGRTGRAARSGEAFTLVTQEDSRLVGAIEKLLGHSLERRKLDDFAYQEPVSQPVGAEAGESGAHRVRRSRKANWSRKRRGRGRSQRRRSAS